MTYRTPFIHFFIVAFFLLSENKVFSVYSSLKWSLIFEDSINDDLQFKAQAEEPVCI